jgi:hypothetical protein
MYGKEDDLVDYNEDGLVDYNDPEEPLPLQGQPPSHTPVQTPQNLDSENEGEEEQAQIEEKEAKRNLEEGRKADEDILARREKHHKEFEALSNRLSENGYKMRMKVWLDPSQSFRPMPMTAPTRTLAEMLQTIPLEDAAQVSEFQGLIYMPQQFLEKYLLPTMQIRKLLETASENHRGINPYPEAQKRPLCTHCTIRPDQQTPRCLTAN